MDRSAHRFRDDDRYYLGHFTSTGTAVVELPAGRYTVVAEKGLEFQRLESLIDLDSDRTIHLAPQRWTHMVEKGWVSADFHVHRPIEQADLLVKAEDLNLGVFFTMWNKVNLWQGK